MSIQRLSLSRRLALLAFTRAGVAPTALDMRDRARYIFDNETRGRNQRFTAPDGLPLPPPRLVYRVVGHFDYELFYYGGVTLFDLIRDMLEHAGVELDSLHAVLDWGCGCGRVIRQWDQVENMQIYGSDYNPELIAWGRLALPFARLSTNGLAPPLPFPDDSFDFLYGISVLTHLDEPLQRPWIDELRRVVKPGGYVLVSVKISSHGLSADEHARYDAGQLVVVDEEFQGRNYCAAVHPDAYVRDVLARGFEPIASLPLASPTFDHGQDAYLFRVPTT